MINKILFPLSISALFGNSPIINVGEKLVYQASFSGIYAADASLEVIERTVVENDSVYHIRFIAKSRGAFNYIFPINDEINLWIDTKTFLPIKIDEQINEGNFKRSQIIFFDRNDNVALVNNDTLSIKDNTQSPYSLFYFFRTKNFQSYRNQKISLIQNNKTVLLNLKIKENEIVNVPAGKYTCTTVSPVREDHKKFKNKAELDIMFSEGVKRHPVKIRLKLKYGYLILKLSQIVN